VVLYLLVLTEEMKRRPSVECRQQPDTFQQLTGCDIVKRGALYLKHPPSILPAAFSIQVFYSGVQHYWHSRDHRVARTYICYNVCIQLMAFACNNRLLNFTDCGPMSFFLVTILAFCWYLIMLE